VELKGTMSKAQVEKEGDREVDERVNKLRNKIVTEEMIRMEVDKRRKQMRKMMQEKNMNLQGSMNARTTTVLKDPDGNIIETGIVDMIESKGLEFTYDADGNIMLVKRPVPKPDPRIRYTLLEGQNA
jgi:hypothetical protein